MTDVASPKLAPSMKPVGMPSSSTGLLGSTATLVFPPICLSLLKTLNSSNLIRGLSESHTGML
mgnify:CR=1 FL=1